MCVRKRDLLYVLMRVVARNLIVFCQPEKACLGVSLSDS